MLDAAIKQIVVNRQRIFFRKTSQNFKENRHRIFVVASATNEYAVFFNGLSEGVPAHPPVFSLGIGS